NARHSIHRRAIRSGWRLYAKPWPLANLGREPQPEIPVGVLRARRAAMPPRRYLQQKQLVRLLPTHRDAMAVASVGAIVPQRVVLRAAVVPKGNRVRRPLEAHAQLGGLNLPIEHFENCVAFALAQTDYVCGEEAIHEQAFFTCLGMRPNNWMLGTRIDFSAVV